MDIGTYQSGREGALAVNPGGVKLFCFSKNGRPRKSLRYANFPCKSLYNSTRVKIDFLTFNGFKSYVKIRKGEICINIWNLIFFSSQNLVIFIKYGVISCFPLPLQSMAFLLIKIKTKINENITISSIYHTVKMFLFIQTNNSEMKIIFNYLRFGFSKQVSIPTTGALTYYDAIFSRNSISR